MGQSDQKSIGFFEQLKIEKMTYEEIVKNLKDKAQNSKFDEILDNFKLYNCTSKITRFPIKTLKEIYINSKIKDNYDIINEMKKEYVKFFKKNCINSYSKYKLFNDKFRACNDYDELVKEQKIYLIYKEYFDTYSKKFKSKKISVNFFSIIIEYIHLESYEKYTFIETHLTDEFSLRGAVYSSNIEEKEKEYFDLLIKKENNVYIENKPKKVYYHNDEDDEDDNYSYDNKISDYNDDYNYNSDNNYSYKHYNTSSGNNYSNNSNNHSNSHSNSHSKNQNKSSNKQKVKVIMCYSCKGKNLCPLCGNKIKSRVSLGNLYAHSNCYNEGTCCLCNKKGPGNQVQSICSNCRKDSISKGLTGSARCFICRNLI